MRSVVMLWVATTGKACDRVGVVGITNSFGVIDGNILIGQGRTDLVNIGIDMPEKYAGKKSATDTESKNVKEFSDRNR